MIPRYDEHDIKAEVMAAARMLNLDSDALQHAIATCAVVKAELDAEAERMNRILTTPLAPSSAEGTPQ